MGSVLTPLLLHVTRFQTFVEEADTETYVYRHALFVDLAGDTVLDENVR